MSLAALPYLLTQPSSDVQPAAPGGIDVTAHTRADGNQLQAARDFVARLKADRAATTATATIPENAPQ